MIKLMKTVNERYKQRRKYTELFRGCSCSEPREEFSGYRANTTAATPNRPPLVPGGTRNRKKFAIGGEAACRVPRTT